MSSGFKKTAAAIAMSAMVIAPVAMAGLVLTTEAAFAKSERGESNSGGKNDRGKDASALKNMNAVNSWKSGQGKYHAHPTSNVRLIATYLDLTLDDFADLLNAAETDLADFLVLHGLDVFDAADNYVAACAASSDCLAPESDYDDLVFAVTTAIAGSDLAFSDPAFVAIRPDGFEPLGDDIGAMMVFFNTALGF